MKGVSLIGGASKRYLDPYVINPSAALLHIRFGCGIVPSLIVGDRM